MKFTPRTKAYFKTLAQYFLITMGVFYAIAVGWGSGDEPIRPDFKAVLTIVGVMAIFVLGHVIAINYIDSAYPRKKEN